MAAALLLLLRFIAAVDYQSNDDNQFEWEIITADKFSSQIRLHPYVILLVTVPWCGESRSLMREISRKLAEGQHEFSSVKLIVLHRNLNKVLASSLDAAEGISVFCYHHAVSYRYLGDLRAQEILSSMHYLMSAAPKELPLKTLHSSEDLNEFLASTDKAVLLLESCGWTYKLLMQHYGNTTLQGGILPELLDEDTNSTLASGRHKNLKEVINKMMSSEIEDVCSTSPWVGGFSAENGTASPTDENVHPTFRTSCNFEEYKKFESFFLKFVATARDLYLPPQRQKYGLVSQRLLLSPLGVEVSDQWSLVISYAGCPGCLTILKDDNHLHDALERHDLPVVELHDRGEYLGPSLPIDKPSVLLFVDRTSDLVETRRRSQEALHAFKEVALQHWKLNEVDGHNSTWPNRPSLHTDKGSTNVFESHRSLLSPPSQKNDKKMSIMIMNEGQQVTLNNEALNLEGSSLQEILTRLVVKKNQLELKLSSLAKEAGFQLVSDDMAIKVGDMSPHTQSQHLDSTGNSVESSNEDNNDMNKEEMDKLSPMEQQGEQSRHVSVEAPDTDIDRKASADVASKESSFLDPGQSVSTDKVVSPLDLDPKIQTYVLSEKPESVEQHFSGVGGSFLFSECNYQLLRSLTNGSKVPRIVIVDPISQQHYILPEVANLTSKSISTFIEGFLNGTLTPYRRSGPSRNSIEKLQPPFVNFDFHEKDSIPSVTTRMFSELVLGSDEHGDQNATNTSHKDVVVLFSNSWCGFCQRMELVVREVYQAFKSYGNMVNTDSKDKEELSGENFKDSTARLPAFYSIDCTLNDCGGILKSLGQSEVYPTLVLFPAERKTPVTYDGNMMATNVIKFIVNHGSNLDLAKLEGTLWIDGEEREGHDDQFEGTFTSGDTNYFPLREEYIGASLKNTISKDQHKFNPNEKTPLVNIALGSFLVATDHLQDGLNPFNKARVLIVGANPELGFQGLIVNKPISWNSVQFEDAKLYELLKDAPISFGGPVIQEGLSFVSLAKSPLNAEYPQVLTGVYFLDPLATVKEIEKIRAGDRNASDYWFFWGYSGWSWDQLFGEVNGGAWATVHEGELNELRWP